VTNCGPGKSIIYLVVFGAIFCITACEQSIVDAPEEVPSATGAIDDWLLEVAREHGLTLIDVSVAFERPGEAPGQLQRIADALNDRSPGLYVMRYYDDTLRHVLHIFSIRQSGSAYIELTSYPMEQPARRDFAISRTEYDEQTSTLILQTTTGSIRLSPSDVTPVGA